MNVLITGGTGFIGSRLALDCAKRGEQVRVLAKCNTPAERSGQEELRQAGIDILNGDVTDRQAVDDACRDVQILYHLAAAQHEANVDDDYFRRINVEGTRTVMDAALEAGVERVVHGSTIGVYGSADHGPVHDRTPLFPDNIYGRTKLEGEHLARGYADRLNVAIVRISETYGPGDYRLLKLFKGINSRKFFMVGKGGNLHHPVYIDDLIEGLRRAASSDEAIGQTMVLAGPRAVTTREMVDGISEAMGTRGPKITVPLPVLMGAAVAIETLCRPLKIPPPLHRRRMNFFVKSFRFSCDAARDKLGFEPKIDFTEGARRTAKWYEETGLL